MMSTAVLFDANARDGVFMSKTSDSRIVTESLNIFAPMHHCLDRLIDELGFICNYLQD